jgi:hypothetical protein
VIRAAIALGAVLDLVLARLLPETGVGLYFRLGAATLLLLLPGGLIAEALGRRSASATLIWSLASLAGALAIGFVFGLPLIAVLGMLAAVSVVALVVARRRLRPPRIGGSAVVFALGIAFGIALWHVAGNVGGDGLFHLARVRKLEAFDELSLSGVNEFADGGLHPGYAFPLWHGFLALVATLAGVDPEAVVLHEPSLLAPLAFLVIFEAGATLFRSAWLGLAVLAADVGLASLAGGHGGSYVSLAQPAIAGQRLLVPAVLTLVFAYVREPAWAVLPALAAGGLTLALIHPAYAVFIALPLAGFLVARALLHYADVPRLAAALAAFCVPVAAVLLALLPTVRDTVSHEPVSAELERALTRYADEVEVVGQESYRLAPEVPVRSGAVAVAALALLPLAAFAARRRWAAFVLGGSTAVLALMLVPELFVRLSDAVSLSQSRRAAAFIPFEFALAGGAAILAGWLHVLVLPLGLAAGVVLQREFPGDFIGTLEGDGGPGVLAWFALFGGATALLAAVVLARLFDLTRRRDVLAGLAVVLFTVPIGVHAARNWTPSERRPPSPLTPGLVQALREEVPEGAVVFSDLETSYRIGAAAPVYVAAGPPAHVADTDENRPYERRLDVMRFFRTADVFVLRQYGAGWLVVDKQRFDRFKLEKVVGKRVYADGRYVLYELERSRSTNSLNVALAPPTIGDPWANRRFSNS